WLNPVSVGINDITPDDESSWAVRNNDINKILFEKINCHVPEKLPTSLYYEIDSRSFFQGWDNKSIKHVTEINKDLIKDINLLLTSSNIDVKLLIKLDRELYAISSKIDNPLALRSIRTLQLQLANYVTSNTFEPENTINFIYDFYRKKQDDLLSAIKLFSRNDADTKIIVWYNSVMEKNVFLREVISCVLRSKKVDSYINENKKNLSKEDAGALRDYAKLKMKELFSMLDDDGYKKIITTNAYIKERDKLSGIIYNIENSIISGHESFDIIRSNQHEWGDLSTVEQFKKFEFYVKSELSSAKSIFDDIKNKYITDPETKRNVLYHQLDSDIKERIAFLDISHYAYPGSLLEKLQLSGYVFSDINIIAEYLLASYGVSGHYSHGVVYPAPSDKLLELLRRHTKSNSEWIEKITPYVYDILSDNVSNVLRPPLSEEQKKILNDIKLEISKSVSEQYFMKLTEQKSSVIGIKYSVDFDRYNENLFLSLPINQNLTLPFMYRYFEMLYDIHIGIIENKANREFIYSKFSSLNLDFLINDERVLNLEGLIKKYKYLSLSEIHRTLTNSTSFADISIPLLQTICPSITTIIKKTEYYGHQLTNAMTVASVVKPYDFSNLGAINSIDKSVSDVPALHTIVEQAKYNLLSWNDFYNTHASIWDTIARQHKSTNIEFHPQSLLFDRDSKGKCLGLSLLYLDTGGYGGGYQKLRHNIDTASTLYQTKYNDNLKLSNRDDFFLRKTQRIITMSNELGNNRLKNAQLEVLELKDPILTEGILYQRRISSLLITTEYHSLALQQISSFWRVTDPNFGHCDFHSLAQALTFIKNITSNRNFSSLYGSGIVKIYFSESLNNWKYIKLPLVQTGSLLRDIYLTTPEKLSTSGGSLNIMGHLVPVSFIYDIGGVINGNRISESTDVKNKIRSLKINGDILQHYINTHYLSEEQTQKIKDIVDFLGIQDNTIKVKLESDIKPISEIQQPLHSILSRQKEHVKNLLSGLLDEFSNKLRKQGLSLKTNVLSVNNFKESKINSDTVEVTVTDLQGRLYRVDIDTRVIGLTFKEGINSLSEALEHMNIDAIMSVIGLVQYARMIKMNDNISAIDHAGAVSDIKNIVDKFLGGILTLTNNRVYNPGGVSGASLEGFISSGLEVCASRMGGTAGRYLSNVAKVIKLPLLDIGINIWSLYDSSLNHAKATTQIEYISTAIDVSFSSINTALSIGAIAYPPLAIAIVPITIFSHEVKNYAVYVNQINERHKLWLEAEKYLDNGSAKVLSINKATGIIDLSNNQVLGNIYLDMRENPPILHGEKSYNSGKNIGSHPDMTDREIMESRAYNFACTKLSDAGEPDIFGWGDKEICNSMELSESQLANGYSNRQWPSQIPVIPEGIYNTVYLGYGETLRANTEVTLSSTGYFYEIARAYTDDELSEPLLTVCNQHSHVIGGKEPLTIIIPAIEHGMLGSNLHMIERFKNYNFSISGGKGGIKLMVGGIGDYNIECTPGVRNIISFEQLSRDFNLDLDLSDGRKQNFNFHHPSGFYSGKVMSITQKGINAVVGTKLGYDKIRGNNLDNTFSLGSGGGVIYSGGGSNTYFVPATLQDNLHIYISEKSNGNHIILGDMHSRLSIECHFSNNEREFIKMGYYNGCDVILESDTIQKIKSFAKNITIQTADGVMANWDDKLNTLSVYSIDMIAWRDKNKTAKEPLPVDVIQLTNWRMHNTCSLFYDKYQVDIEANKLTYTVLFPDTELPVQLNYTSIIYGNHGAKYTFLNSGSKTIDIHILDKNSDYDTFDFRNIIFEHYTNEIFISFDNQGGFVISILNNATSEAANINVFRKNMTSLDSSGSLIYLPSGDIYHISDIYKMSRGRKSFKLNVEKKPDIDDIINVAILETSYLQIKKIPNNDDSDYILCLDNPNLSSYTLNFNDLSGYISSLWDNIRGSFTPFHKNTVNIAPNEKKYISLIGLDKLSFNIDVFRQALEVKNKNSYKISKFTWETYGDIVVSPEDRISHLELDGFNYFSQPELDTPISDSFSYLYDNFQIVDSDVHIKLLHLNRETKQITPHRIILKRYFIDSFAKTSITDREKNIYPVICDSPDHFTSDIYRHPFRIVLGNKTLYPSEELVKFISTSKEYLSNMDVINNVIVPQKTTKKNKLSIVSLNSNIKNDIVLSGVMTGTSKIFHLNNSGDLLLTTSKTHGGGVVVIFKDFINNWWKYNLTLITVPIDNKLS
ncbi:toxin B, partial [Escherichia coli]